MALRGTLKDFGIADIFQLITHQAKTGTLAVRNKDHTVQIHFLDGNIAGAESATRDKKDRIGSMLIRAEAVTPEELDNALGLQRQSKKRLGEILVEHTSLDEETLRAFTRLQMTETMYRLFVWDSGGYEFSAGEVTLDPGTDVTRSDNILMEGFRQVDEWPTMRRKISGYGLVYEQTDDLEALLEAAGPAESDDIDLDDAFGEFDLGDSSPSDPRLRNIAANEKRVFGLIDGSRDVQKIIDLSRLGEFEACKALVNLLDAQVLGLSAAGERKSPSADATVGGITSGGTHWIRLGVRAATLGLLLASIGYGAWTIGGSLQRLVVPRVTHGHMDQSLQRMLSRSHMPRIRQALEVFRAHAGIYPNSLVRLVELDLLTADDLSFPWSHAYLYDLQKNGTYALNRPAY